MNGGWIFLIALILLILASYLAWLLWARTRASRLGLPPPSYNPFASFSSPSSSATAAFPAPAAGGVKGWFDTQIRRFKNRNNRYAAGAYEESGYNGQRGTGAGGRGFDGDEAWDTRVGNEAVYEETELGLHPPPAGRDYNAHTNTNTSASAFGDSGNPYRADTTYRTTSPYTAPGEPEGGRGRSRTRDHDHDYDHDEANLTAPTSNPFGDDARSLGARSGTNPFGDDAASASSLRGVSPRPVGELQHQNSSYAGAAGTGQNKDGQGQEGRGPHVQVPAAHRKNGSLEDSPTERRSEYY